AERVIRAQRDKRLPRGYLPGEIADEALRAGIIDAGEADLLKQARKARLEAHEVDVFSPDQYLQSPPDAQPQPEVAWPLSRRLAEGVVAALPVGTRREVVRTRPVVRRTARQRHDRALGHGERETAQQRTVGLAFEPDFVAAVDLEVVDRERTRFVRAPRLVRR